MHFLPGIDHPSVRTAHATRTIIRLTLCESRPARKNVTAAAAAAVPLLALLLARLLPSLPWMMSEYRLDSCSAWLYGDYSPYQLVLGVSGHTHTCIIIRYIYTTRSFPTRQLNKYIFKPAPRNIPIIMC